MDVGTLKSLPAETIRILVWILSFMTFGYATAEFEVTSERLGVYRPEEHIEYVVLRSFMSCRMYAYDLICAVTPRIMPIIKMLASSINDCGALCARSSWISTPKLE